MDINNKLVLRVLNSPWANDIKTSVDLSKTDKFYPIYKSFDNNFIYLKGETIKTGTTKDNKLILNKVNGEDIEVDLKDSSVTGPELKNYAGHILAGYFGGYLTTIIEESYIDSRQRDGELPKMPPGYLGIEHFENYQIFEMDQFLRSSPEENGEGNFLYLEKIDNPQDALGPEYDLSSNLFQIHGDSASNILADRTLTRGMDIAFVVDGALSKFRIQFVMGGGNDVFICLENANKVNVINYNKGGSTIEWSDPEPEYNIQNDMTLVPGEDTSSFYLSEVRVLNYVNAVIPETFPNEPTETVNGDNDFIFLPGDSDLIELGTTVLIQNRDYSHLNLHASKAEGLENTDPTRPYFHVPQGSPTQFWLIRYPEYIHDYKGYKSRAIIPAVVETDYEVRFNKLRSSYVVKK